MRGLSINHTLMSHTSEYLPALRLPTATGFCFENVHASLDQEMRFTWPLYSKLSKPGSNGLTSCSDIGSAVPGRLWVMLLWSPVQGVLSVTGFVYICNFQLLVPDLFVSLSTDLH